MKLHKHEIHSALWLRLEAHLSEQLDVLRRKNDGLLSHEDTQRLRGRIAQIKEILALSEAEPAQEGATDDAAAISSGHLVAGFSQERV